MEIEINMKIILMRLMNNLTFYLRYRLKFLITELKKLVHNHSVQLLNLQPFI